MKEPRKQLNGKGTAKTENPVSILAHSHRVEAGTSHRSWLLKGVIAAGLAAMLLVGVINATTAAHVSDTETSTANTFTAKTLNLALSVEGSYTGGSSSLYQVTAGSDGLNGKVVFDRIAPGQSGTIRWVLSSMAGSGGTLAVSCAAVFTEGGTPAEPESLISGNNNGGNGDLDRKLKVTLKKGVGADDSITLEYAGSSTPWDISILAAALNAQSTAMSGGGGASDTVVYELYWELDKSKSDAEINVVQSDTAELDITFTLNQ